MKLSEVHEERKRVLDAFFARLSNMDVDDQRFLIESLSGFVTGEGGSPDEWRRNAEEAFVDPPCEIRELDLNRPVWKAVGED